MNRAQEDYISLAARILLSLLFLYSGFGKLMTPAATLAYIDNAGIPFVTAAYAGAIFVELILAAALVIGFRTQLVAAAMAVFTIITALIFHHNFAEKAQLIGFLKNIAICGGLLQVVVSGPGLLSLDAKLKKAK